MPARGDPFGTAALRARVLAAWAASPARFREDANAEDDLVRGGYRDRVVVELAQNAADAAARAGEPGHLTLRLTRDLLVAENTGAPLDAAGVESLSTLRASTKRDDSSVGRFGVGFAAVLAVTDAPRIVSSTGGVRWDADAARREVAAIPSLAAEAGRRHGQVPVLRLPYAWESSAPTATRVELPLRDAAARSLVAELLDQVDDALLVALPALERIDVDVDGATRTVAGLDRWQVVRRSGRAGHELLADRPVEERDRPGWSVTWARPLAGQPVPDVLHAPTPTDEPLALPALLVAGFPLDTTRRHVAPGPLTEALVGEAAATYVELVGAVDDPADRWALVPGPVPAGRLDGLLRAAIRDRLADAPVLRTVDGIAVAPRDAVSVVGASAETVAALAGVVGGLVPDNPALDSLGGRRLRIADVVDLLADLRRDPTWWHSLYTAFGTGPVDVDALGALPVPLADGRLVRGPRGTLLPGPDLPPDASALGLRLVHPAAAHPLLLRLGAAEAHARTLLDRAEARAAVEAAWDALPEAAPVVDAVLGLVAAADLRPGELPWLRTLRLEDDSGQPAAADELVLPGSVVAGLVDDDLATVADSLVERWGPRTLAAVGVLADLTVHEVHDVVLQPDMVDDDAAPGLADWVEWVLGRLDPQPVPPTVRALAVVPELDVVADDRWWRVVELAAADPALRSAVVDPVPVELSDGRRANVASYASWFLRTHGLVDGRPLGELAVPGSDLAELWDPMPPVTADRAVLRAAGVRTSVADLLGDSDGVAALLDRLADPARPVTWETVVSVYRALATEHRESVVRPARVRVDPSTVLPADRVVVVDAPHHLQLDWPDPPLVVPLGIAHDLADVLDVSVSSERVPRDADLSGGTRLPVPDEVRRLLPATPGHWWEHDELVVSGQDLTWWVTDDGSVHAATGEGLARGLAWAAGDWAARWRVGAVLEDPARVGELAVEARLED